MTAVYVSIGVGLIIGLYFWLRSRKKRPDPPKLPIPGELDPGPDPVDPVDPIDAEPTPKPKNSVTVLFNLIKTSAQMKLDPRDLIAEYERQIRDLNPDWDWGDPIPNDFTFVQPAELVESRFKLPAIRVDWLHGMLFAALVVIGASWYGNVEYHWRENIARNRDIALNVNRYNLARIDSIRDTLLTLNKRLDSSELGVVNAALRLTIIRNQLTTLDSLRDPEIFKPLDPAPWTLADSARIRRIERTRAFIWMYVNDSSQAVLKYGTTKGGPYPFKGRPEESFNWTNHSLGIGNGEDGPLDPGTTYYVIGEAVNKDGKMYRMPEIEITTNQ